MINIAICEDEELIQRQLVNILTDYFKVRNIDIKISNYYSGKALLKACESSDFFCIFMDIDLGDDNGIDIMKEIREFANYPVHVIFVTSFTEYKDQVLSLHTFDYIVKPFKNKEINKVLDDLLFWKGKDYNKPIKKIKFKTIEGILSLSIDEILYLEYVNRRIEIVTFSTTYHMYGKMKEVYGCFKQYDYVVPHISFIVNMKEIKKYLKSKNIIEMADGKEIPISQLKAREFRDSYNVFLSKAYQELVHI